jgi:signal transduction histidine kinase
VGLLLLLPLLAILQYQWIGRITEVDRLRLRETLYSSAERFGNDLRAELSRPMTTFRLRPEEFEELPAALAGRMNQWLETAPHPAVLRRIFAVERQTGGSFHVESYDSESGTLVPEEWSPDFDFGNRLAKTRDNPLLFIPAMGPPRGPRPERAPLAGFGGGRSIAVELDSGAVSSGLVPELVQRHFPSAFREDYVVAIVPRGRPEDVVYRTGPPEVDLSSPDLVLDLLEPGPGRPRPRPEGRRGGGRGGPPPFPGEGLLAVGQWQILIKHRAGSLDAAATELQWRNFAISSGILLVLAAGLVVVGMSSARARSLAALQLEFVARVSHELRTPLAVIRSAAYNLSTGIIQGKDQVQQYGKMVEDEGKRLSDMVDQIMLFARMESGQARYDARPLDIDETVAAVLETLAPSIQESKCSVTRNAEPGLPKALADPVALKHSLQNLIVNALKYGKRGESVNLTISAKQDSHSAEIHLAVCDDGPGIDPSDIPHLFEPFYRGRNAGSDVPGNGLGLNLVKRMMAAQGGSVSVTSNSGGTCFTLHIPSVKADS